MSYNHIYIHFAYRDGDSNKLTDSHFQKFTESNEFETSPAFIELTFSSVQIHTNDVGSITAMSNEDKYIWESEDRELDIWEAPLIRYAIKEPQYLLAENIPTDVTQSGLLGELVDLVEIGYRAGTDRPIAVYLEVPPHKFAIDQSGQPPFTAESIAHDQYHHLSWLTVFPPAMVDHYGRETLLSAPAMVVEEFDDGAIVVICTADPLDWDMSCRDVAEHIGLKSFEDL